MVQVHPSLRALSEHDPTGVGGFGAYVKVLLPMDATLQGKRVVVRVTDTSRFHIVGEVIDRTPLPVNECLSPLEIEERMESMYV